MQTINLTPNDLGQRNYVFVDEHNRHKRLKVMRACEGCRRRKIKCDAATTNTWPCSACVRLKLHCVPPMVQYDRDFTLGMNNFSAGDHHSIDFDASSGASDEDFQGHSMASIMNRKDMGTEPMPQFLQNPAMMYRQIHGSEAGLDPNGHYNHHLHAVTPTDQLTQPHFSPMNYQHPSVVYPQPISTPQQSHNEGQWNADGAQSSFGSSASVGGVLGQLKIDESGAANYISAQGRKLAEAPAYEDDDSSAYSTVMPGLGEYAVRIKPEDMPSDEEALELFAVFFADIHPYMPIVNKSAFYRQWSTSRESISPLLLETIFACAGRMSNDPSRGLKWIIMASKHMECFFDVPRLSTVQALLILLKARESAPQRGYFFRSWMSNVTIIAMARDLSLDRHFELHKSPHAHCPDTILECQTKTRVWQACFIVEYMLAASQGRERMNIDPATVDLTIPGRMPDLDDHEVLVYRNFVYFVYLLKNLRRMSDVYTKVKKSKNWQTDPELLALAPALDSWNEELPPDLKYLSATDIGNPTTPPPTHFIGNVHCYFNLAKILLHRPALTSPKGLPMNSRSAVWRLHLQVCSVSAKAITRITETVMTNFGIKGLQCMIRGVNFSIYGLLSATLIHLIASTCPDPAFNMDAREYFQRSMRLLENLIEISASSEMKSQLDNLREAFSVDVARPFVVHPAFPFQAPVVTSSQNHSPITAVIYPNSSGEMQAMQYANPLSPPPSIVDSKGHSPDAMLMHMSVSGHENIPAQTVDVWNPSKVFYHWNNAFGANSVPSQTPVTLSPPQPVTALPVMGGTDPYGQQARNLPPHPSGFVSPGMWQDSVASAYVTGSKRPWNFE